MMNIWLKIKNTTWNRFFLLFSLSREWRAVLWFYFFAFKCAMVVYECEIFEIKEWKRKYKHRKSRWLIQCINYVNRKTFGLTNIKKQKTTTNYVCYDPICYQSFNSVNVKFFFVRNKESRYYNAQKKRKWKMDKLYLLLSCCFW